MYRLVQEALTNIVKHAQATVARVVVSATDEAVTVEVRDNGIGFEVEGPKAGFGLAGMRERVYLAGGTLTLTSGADGTTLVATLPVSVGPGTRRRDMAGRAAS